MYDEDAKLYYRDARYTYPKHETRNGHKDFWSRGNGWVFAGLAKVLQDLPKDAIHRDLYLSRFKEMAETKSQRVTQFRRGNRVWCGSS